MASTIALFHRGDEVARYRAPEDGVLELVALTPRQRLHLDPAVAELPPASGLLLVPTLGVRLLADGLPIRDLRRMKIDLHAEAALELVEDDLHVHLAGAGDEHLLGLRVEAQLHGRVLFAQTPETVGHLLLVAPGLRGDGEGDGRRRELVTGEADRMGRVGQRVAGAGLLQLGQRDDVAGARLLDRLGLLALHQEDVAGALLLVRAAVEQLRVGGDLAREEPHQVHPAGELVVDGLEHEQRRGGAMPRAPARPHRCRWRP